MKGKSNRRAPRRNKRRNRVSKHSRNETAFIKETVALENLKPNIPYENITTLALFQRATDMADNFQEYRIKKVEYKYKPLYDTYADASGSDSLPYLFSKRLTYSSPATFTLDWLRLLGTKPRRLDDKTLNVSYRPNINLVVAGTVFAPGPLLPGSKPIMSPWIQTHQLDGALTSYIMDATPHYGNAFIIEQSNTAGGNNIIAELEVIAHFEFRKPWDKNVSVGGSVRKVLVSAK